MVRNSPRVDDDDVYAELATISNARAGDHLDIPRCASPEPVEFDAQSVHSHGSGRSVKTTNTVKSGGPIKSTVKGNGAVKTAKTPSPGKATSSVQFSPKTNAPKSHVPKPKTPKAKSPLAMPQEFDEKDYTYSSETLVNQPAPTAFLDPKHGQGHRDLERNGPPKYDGEFDYERHEPGWEPNKVVKGSAASLLEERRGFKKYWPTAQEWPHVAFIVLVVTIIVAILGIIIYSVVPSKDASSSSTMGNGTNATDPMNSTMATSINSSTPTPTPRFAHRF